MLQSVQLSLIKKMICEVTSKIAAKIYSIHLKCKDKGGILIEFAFCIPVCIILLFFASDHYRFYELRNKVKTSTYLMASMLQHLTNTSEDKYIDEDDIRRIIFASCMNFFHTTSMFSPWPFGVSWCGKITYVKKTGDKSYTAFSFTFDTGTNTDKTVSGISCTRNNITVTDPTTLSPDMSLANKNDEKVLIEAEFKPIAKAETKQRGTFGFKANTEPGDFNKSKLGLFILSAKKSYFVSKVVVTPKPGLFTANTN